MYRWGKKGLCSSFSKSTFGSELTTSTPISYSTITSLPPLLSRRCILPALSAALSRIGADCSAVDNCKPETSAVNGAPLFSSFPVWGERRKDEMAVGFHLTTSSSPVQHHNRSQWGWQCQQWGWQCQQWEWQCQQWGWHRGRWRQRQ